MVDLLGLALKPLVESMSIVGIMRWSAVERANAVMIRLAKSQTDDHRHASKSQIKSIGIDLGKTAFHLIALGTRAQVRLLHRV